MPSSFKLTRHLSACQPIDMIREGLFLESHPLHTFLSLPRLTTLHLDDRQARSPRFILQSMKVRRYSSYVILRARSAI